MEDENDFVDLKVKFFDDAHAERVDDVLMERGGSCVAGRGMPEGFVKEDGCYVVRVFKRKWLYWARIFIEGSHGEIVGETTKHRIQ